MPDPPLASNASSNAARSSSSCSTGWPRARRTATEIASTLSAATAGELDVTDGTLYPVLYRLERAGYVEVRWETPARGVPRKYYSVTDAGRRERATLTREWFTFADAMARLLGHDRRTS